MRIVLFCHSLLSDWNHGNAHFLRGLVTELRSLGNEVVVREPADAWSLRNLLQDHGERALEGLRAAYPDLRPIQYDPATLDLEESVRGADVVIVHEWNDPALVAGIGAIRKRRDFLLLFHDTHHRSVTDPGAMAAFDLSSYDAVLAFGEVVRSLYLERRWTRRAYTWHEAADARVFRPRPGPKQGDLVWIGNWGDDERTQELREFLINPVRQLGIQARVYGVRYPQQAIQELQRAGIEYAGYLPNYLAPQVYGRFKVTVHVPRRPYAESLPGIPTIRPFEAMSCGIPLISAPWEDREQLFATGRDYLLARDGSEMTRLIARVLRERELGSLLARRGRQTVLERHTCAHRARQLLGICSELLHQRPAALARGAA